MARQMTLFGTVLEKGQFFKGLPSADDNTGYFVVVEVLWTLDKSNERATFLPVLSVTGVKRTPKIPRRKWSCCEQQILYTLERKRN